MIFRKAVKKEQVMTFEQPSELNQYLAPPRESGAPSPFWQVTKISSPMSLFLCLLMMEIRRSKGLPVFEGLLGCLVFIAMPGLIIWGYGKFAERSKRKLSIYEDGIWFSHDYWRRLPWKRIENFRIEPCGSRGELKRITARYTRSGAAQPGYWSMIFASDADCATLIEELEKRRVGKDRKWAIEVLRAPVSISRESMPLAPSWLLILGLLLFYHGFPMLAVGLVPARYDLHPTVPRGSEASIRALAKHFPKSIDPGEFLAMTGGALTSIGAGIFWLAERSLHRWRKRVDALEAEDVAKKLVTAPA